MTKKLDGWTKVGDSVNPNGKWTVYRFKGKEFDTVDILYLFPPEDGKKILHLYELEVKKMKRGAIWLVAPDGKIVAMIFLRVGG